MTEKAPKEPETQLHTPEASIEPVNSSGEQNQEPIKHEHQDDIARIQATIERQATSSSETAQNLHSQPSQTHAPLIDETSRRQKLRQSLTRIQKRLPAPDRVLSRIIHQPLISSVSEVGAKTIARPSGILGGGIFAFIGSLGLLLVSRHYGFSYNYLLFLLLFGGGFLVGMSLEISWFALKLSRQRRSK